MTDVTLARKFEAPPARVFEFVTRPEMLMQWWGHDGWVIEDAALDFTQPGPWFARMRSDEGNPFHHGGEVIEVGEWSVRFTWQWINANGHQSGVSEVTFTVAADASGSLFSIHHTGLPDDDFGRAHAKGWTAGLDRLGQFVQSQTDPKRR